MYLRRLEYTGVLSGAEEDAEMFWKLLCFILGDLRREHGTGAWEL